MFRELNYLLIGYMFKILKGSKVDLVFHPSEVDQISHWNSWGLSD